MFTDLVAAIPGEVTGISRVVNEIVRMMDLPEVQVQVPGMKAASKAGAKSETARAGKGPAKTAPRARPTAAAKASQSNSKG